MKRSAKTMLGVTLLEIMLVLAIAALVIIMSIRFYQSASTSNKVNAASSSIQSIVAAAENYLSSGGTVSSITTAKVTPYLPGGVMPPSPWTGVESAIASSPTSTTYTITMDAPGAATSGSVALANNPCSQLMVQLNQNKSFKATCASDKISVAVNAYGSSTSP